MCLVLPAKNIPKHICAICFVVEEYLAAQIASLQNLSFYLWLVTEARTKIKEGTFTTWKNEMVVKLMQRL
jgi:queuine tRNA-ribosyltransferase